MLKGTSCCWVPSVVSDSVRPTDSSPPGCPIPGILQARTLEWVAISFSNAWKWKVKVKSLSCVRPSATPWTAAYQAPPSMGFSRQEYCSGVPLPWSEGYCLFKTKGKAQSYQHSTKARDSLVVQWLALHFQGELIRFLVRELRALWHGQKIFF